MNTKKPNRILLIGNPAGGIAAVLAKLAFLGHIDAAAQKVMDASPRVGPASGKRKAQWKEERNKR